MRRILRWQQRHLFFPILAMGLVILLSNTLVQIPIDFTFAIGNMRINLADILTYAALSYPLAFLVTDITNRLFGAMAARKVVGWGFALGVVLSLIAGDVRIALASGTAFLIAHLMDVFVFDHLRHFRWWTAPVLSSFIGSALDTLIFFTLAFYGTGLPWINWALGDMAAKLVMIGVLLYPFKWSIQFFAPRLSGGSEWHAG